MTLASILLTFTQALLYAITPNHYGNYLGVEKPILDSVEYDTRRWWGPSLKLPIILDENIYPANITFSNSMITDLKSRLNTSINSPRPFTNNLNNVGFRYGFNPEQVVTWLKIWNEQYDFAAQEKLWNQFPAFRTNVQGIDIFFLRISPPKNTTKQVIPMILLHGFPGSIREFWDAIPMLTAESPDRDFVIDLIVPSLPGFGFSSPAHQPGMGAPQIAIVLRNFMRRLGYKKWYAQGGDIGGLTLEQMVTLFPTEVLGFHTNCCGHVLSPAAIFLQIMGSFFPTAIVPAQFYSRMYPLDVLFPALVAGSGYAHMQGTKPGSLGVPMTDSPAALASYVLEFYASLVYRYNSSQADGGLFKNYEPTFLIDILMYYWSTHSFETAIRVYSETFNKKGMFLTDLPTNTPTWIVQAAGEGTFQSPLILGLKFKNILKIDPWTVGGHFTAHELPVPYTASVFEAITAFRAWHAKNGTDTNVLL